MQSVRCILRQMRQNQAPRTQPSFRLRAAEDVIDDFLRPMVPFVLGKIRHLEGAAKEKERFLMAPLVFEGVAPLDEILDVEPRLLLDGFEGGIPTVVTGRGILERGLLFSYSSNSFGVEIGTS